MKQKCESDHTTILVRVLSSLAKVFSDCEPDGVTPFRLLSVFRGESVSFQIAYCVREDELQGITGNCDMCEIPVRIRLRAERETKETHYPALRIRTVEPIYCKRPCNPDSYDEDYLLTTPGWAPDLLRDLELSQGKRTPEGITWETEISNAGAGTWRSLWMDVTPEEDTAPGHYRFQIRIGEDATDWTEVEIQVVDQTLPPLDIPHTEWFHYDGLADYYGVEVFSERFWAILESFLHRYVKSGANTLLTPIVTPPLDTEIGMERTTVQLVGVEVTAKGYELDFTHFDRFIDLGTSCGIQYFEICHLFTQWGAAAAPKVVAKKDGVLQRIFGWDTPSDDPEYLAFLSALLPAVRKRMEERGLLDHTFFHISDEPDLNSVHYQGAQETVRRLLSGVTLIEAVSDYEYFQKGLVDIPVCAENYLKPFLEKRPERLWTYYCCAQTRLVPNRFIAQPSYRNRISGLLWYWHGIDGFLHWGFNFYNGERSRERIDPYRTADGDGSYPAGDPFLVYPGANGVPEDSIRIMVQEEAIADYRALKLLESRIGRERVLALCREEAGMELSFEQYPKGEEFLLRLRERVNQLLVME